MDYVNLKKLGCRDNYPNLSFDDLDCHLSLEKISKACVTLSEPIKISLFWGYIPKNRYLIKDSYRWIGDKFERKVA
jgi:hypothetical protein